MQKKGLVALAAALMILAAGVVSAQTVVQPIALPDGLSVTHRSGTATAGLPDYSNTTNSSGYYYNHQGRIVADDVSRTTSLPLVAVAFGYYCPTAVDTITATMHIYDGNTNPLVVYNLGEIAGQGAWSYKITLPEPLAAPQDLWIGLKFSDATTGLLIYGPPTIGDSDDVFAVDTTADGNLDTYYWFGGNPYASFYLETYPVPEPGSLFALGAGLAGLVAIRRRR